MSKDKKKIDCYDELQNLYYELEDCMEEIYKAMGTLHKLRDSIESKMDKA